jgi:hypothetical protein
MSPNASAYLLIILTMLCRASDYLHLLDMTFGGWWSELLRSIGLDKNVVCIKRETRSLGCERVSIGF